MKKEDRIYIERFDDLHGLSTETLNIINLKIDGVKTQCEFNISKLRKANEEMHLLTSLLQKAMACEEVKLNLE